MEGNRLAKPIAAAHADDDEDDNLGEMKENMSYLLARRPRKYQRDEFVDAYMEEISNLYGAIKDYLSVYASPLLQLMDFPTFSNFCYLYSTKTR